MITSCHGTLAIYCGTTGNHNCKKLVGVQMEVEVEVPGGGGPPSGLPGPTLGGAPPAAAIQRGFIYENDPFTCIIMTSRKHWMT